MVASKHSRHLSSLCDLKLVGTSRHWGKHKCVCKHNPPSTYTCKRNNHMNKSRDCFGITANCNFFNQLIFVCNWELFCQVIDSSPAYHHHLCNLWWIFIKHYGRES